MVESNKKKCASLGRWTLVKTLGTGYNSKVKLGYDAETGIYAAVKTIRLDHPSLNLMNLMNEVKVMKALNHPNIVNLIEFNDCAEYVKKDGRKIKVVEIAMELAQGGELFEYVADSGRFSEPVARFYFKQIIETLDYCHKQGITHRDMKPENLLFDDKFNVKLADFGFSTLISGKDGSYQLHTVLGTESYMAPEIHTRKPYSGAAVDLFATAIILFIMISGTPPFAKADPRDSHYRILCLNRFDVFWNAHEKSKPKKPFYTEEFKDLMQKMLALEPTNRLSLNGVKSHPWYNGTTSDLAGIQQEFRKRKELVDTELQKQKEEREREKQKKTQVGGGAFTGFRPFRDGEIEKDLESQLKELSITYDPELKRELKPFEGQVFNPATQLKIVMMPDVLLKQLLVIANSVFTEYTLGKDNYKIKGKIANDDGLLEMNINILGVSEEVQCVEFQKVKGDAITFLNTVEEKFISPVKKIANMSQEAQ